MYMYLRATCKMYLRSTADEFAFQQIVQAFTFIFRIYIPITVQLSSPFINEIPFGLYLPLFQQSFTRI